MHAAQSDTNTAKPSPMRDARVLVTGSTGFIGRHLCHSLHAQRAQLVLLQRREHPVRWPGARSLCVPDADRAALETALKQAAPDVVIHLAGFVSGERSRSAMLHAFDGNVVTSANLLLACLTRLPETRVITASSLEASNPLTTAAVTGSPYGISKLMVEVLSGCLHQLFAAPLFAARLGIVYGPGDPNTSRLVPTLIRAFVRGHAPRLSSGQRRSDFVYIDDVVEGLLAMASTAGLRAPALDLGSGQLRSVRDVAETVASLMGAAVPIHYDPGLDRPDEQERAADMSCTRAVLRLGPPTELRTGLSRTIAAYRAQPASASL